MDYTSWLGPAADDLTPAQRERFDDLVDAYHDQPHHTHRAPEDAAADAAEDDAAMSAILQYVLGEGSITEAAETAQTAQEQARYARALLRGWVRAELARGITEARVARDAGVDRMTVRAWLGK